MKRLYFGDNLQFLRESINSESVDLVYLDPPFNSNADYNVIFGGRKSGDAPPQAQITAFEDTWHWSDESARTLQALYDVNGDLAELLDLLVRRLGHNDLSAYLVMMAIRLVELHRVLKPTGSLYLHCDPTASHYLKVILDEIFGIVNHRNEITWKRQSAHSDAKKKFCDVSDIILYYVKSNKAKFQPQYGEHNPEYITKFYRHDDNDGRGLYQLADMASPNPRPNMMYDWLGFPYPDKGWRYQTETMQQLHDEGRIYYPKLSDGTFDITKRPRLKRYLDEQEGSIVTNVWDDIQQIGTHAKERLGYPTQKPLALLERILQASSKEGDIVLDPFCGCGTALHAAQKLNRNWIGIDITHLAISLIEIRLISAFPQIEFEVFGTPKDFASAQDLAKRDKYQFQWWACSLVKVPPYQGKKKGADGGIDGLRLSQTLTKTNATSNVKSSSPSKVATM